MSIRIIGKGVIFSVASTNQRSIFHMGHFIITHITFHSGHGLQQIKLKMKGANFMINKQLKEFESNLIDLSDIQRKAEGLLRDDFCFTNKVVVIAIPSYQKDAKKPYTLIYDENKLRYCTNLKDALYLQECLCCSTDAKAVEVISVDDIPIIRKELEQIDYLILSHSFTRVDKSELLFELEWNFGYKDMNIIRLK